MPKPAGPTHKVDQIRKLLEVARSAGETSEGKVARKLAEDKMRAAGLTAEEVLSDRKVAMDGRAQIWEQALMEACADLDRCGLEVDRINHVWTLKGSQKASGAAADRFDGLRRQLRRAASAYLDTVRRGMLQVGDDPSTARSVLERMRRVFLESAAISVVIRALERLTAAPVDLGEGEEEAGPDGGFTVPDEEPSRKKQPFEKLSDRFEAGAEVDWDLEIDVPDGVLDPSTAGHEAGSAARLDPPWGDELASGADRRLTG